MKPKSYHSLHTPWKYIWLCPAGPGTPDKLSALFDEAHMLMLVNIVHQNPCIKNLKIILFVISCKPAADLALQMS